jgi:hypothetical protein
LIPSAATPVSPHSSAAQTFNSRKWDSHFCLPAQAGLSAVVHAPLAQQNLTAPTVSLVAAQFYPERSRGNAAPASPRASFNWTRNLWLIDLETGAERQLTNLTPDFDIRDFDISPDGREVVLERAQERSDVVLLDLPRP